MNICLLPANDVMEHFAFPGNTDFAAEMTKAHSHVLFMKGCCVYSSSVKQCLPSVNHEQFPIQMTQNCKHSKCLQILAEKDFPLKLLGRTPIKIYRRADRRRQPRSREHRLAQRKQRRQHSDHERVQRQRQNTTIAFWTKPMKRGNTDCRRFQKRGDWIRQRLKFTVKIIFFDAAIGSKNYALQEYLSKDSGQPIGLYTMSNNGFYSKLYFTMNSLEQR